MLRRSAAALVLAAVAAGVAAPSSRQFPAIAEGVSAGPAQVGGLTSEPARAALEQAYARPLPVAVAGRTLRLDPAQFRVRVDVDGAVSTALAAPSGTAVPVTVTASPAAVRRFVARLARRIDTPARDARLVGFGKRPLIAPGRPGLAVRRQAAIGAVTRALTHAQPASIPTRTLAPARDVESFGPVVIIDRGANSLRLYAGRRLVRTFGVATGQSIYPTPSGLFAIVDKQLNPWWYPPNSSWAQGAKPVPPGPSNPLGTRWMGISAPAVGIHGTPNAASIGYSASHGCVRMRIPDAEWLFQHVAVGTPVLIR
jgi:lipoprotein-anchoring transpeptidase ErfK/SrfK